MFKPQVNDRHGLSNSLRRSVMDSSARPLFCFSDNTSLDTAGKYALRLKAPLLRAEASRACILKDIDLDLRN